VIGRADLLEARPARPGTRAATVDLRSVLGDAASVDAPAVARGHAGGRNDPPLTGAGLDEAVLARLRFGPEGLEPLTLERTVTNADRAVGARVAGEIARRLRGQVLPPATVRLRFAGSAGQSFAAFAVEGMDVVLHGEANDGVAKGMSGGEVVVRPAREWRGAAEVIAGNAVLYGATGGRLFMAGRAGERFAVRNSGALAVVEGTGDHACEYMTAGAVVILGPTGRNLAAGLSGGLLYVLDPEGALESRLNDETAAAGAGVAPAEEAWLKAVLRRHAERTGSLAARTLLHDWRARSGAFRRVTARARPDLVVLPAPRPARHRPSVPAPVAAGRSAAEAFVPDTAEA